MQMAEIPKLYLYAMQTHLEKDGLNAMCLKPKDEFPLKGKGGLAFLNV